MGRRRRMKLIDVVKNFVKATPLVYLWAYYKKKSGWPRSQSNEAEIIARLANTYAIPKVFIEFGFGAWEFNCARLIDDWQGLLIDGDGRNVALARKVLPANMTCKHLWLDLNNLDVIEAYAATRDIGILSIDVDGNDYWFLRSLISIKPAMIICEYNSSFGMRSISVPYEQSFRRFKKHASGLYFGASLAALKNLCDRNGYRLVETSENGVNAFFVRGDLLDPGSVPLDLANVFREKKLKDGSSQPQQWSTIMDLEFVEV